MNIETLIIGSLAVWRLSHALVKENGPMMVFARFRSYLASLQKRRGGFFDMISCVYCTSFWIGLVAALGAAGSVFEWLMYGLAFSGVSMILEITFMRNTK